MNGSKIGEAYMSFSKATDSRFRENDGACSSPSEKARHPQLDWGSATPKQQIPFCKGMTVRVRHPQQKETSPST